MNAFDFLSHEKISDNFYIISEKIGDNCYNIFVVIGSSRVGVFDAGMGFSDGLRRYIEENITDKKPMVCYLTHGDIDHIGSAVLFDEYYMNYRDMPKLKWHLSIPRKIAEISCFCGNDPETIGYCREHYVNNDDFTKNVKEIDDGDLIDLGGVQFLTYRLPGHTPGSLAFYNKAGGYAFVGDSVLATASWGRCRDLEECLKCHTRFMNDMPEDIILYSSHDRDRQGKAMLKDLKAAFEEILAGKNENDEHFVLAFDFLPRELMDPEEFEYDMWCHRAGKAVVPYNSKILPKNKQGN